MGRSGLRGVWRAWVVWGSQRCWGFEWCGAHLWRLDEWEWDDWGGFHVLVFDDGVTGLGWRSLSRGIDRSYEAEKGDVDR